jgi:hypothetical protein
MQTAGEKFGNTCPKSLQQNVCFWHKADMVIALSDVCFWG